MMIILCAAGFLAQVSRAEDATTTNAPQPAVASVPKPDSDGPPAPSPATKPGEREQAAREKDAKPIDKYVDREGWQSGVGYKGMQHYVDRLANHLGKNLPGYVTGIAGGKKGILLVVTFKAQRGFYLAQENTKEFLTAIVNDLGARMPEPVAPVVIVKQNGQEIIRAERVGNEVKVKYLL